MEMGEVVRKYFLTLYHGTNDICSDLICKGGFKEPSKKRNDHWLGNGVYFFREDEEQAYVWGKSRYQYCKETRKIIVLEAYIELEARFFLNLDSRQGIEKFIGLVDEIEEQVEELGIEYETDDPAKLRHLFFGMLPDQYKAVQRTFTGKSHIDNHTLLGLMDLRLHGVQVCVRDISVINDIKVVRSSPKIKKRKKII